MTAIYNSSTSTIEISGTANTLETIYTDINNSSILSKSVDINNISTFILTANVNVLSGAVLNITGPSLPADEIKYILIFNEPSHGFYKMDVRGQLFINNTSITSSTDYSWSIRTISTSGGRITLENVDISKCGKADGTNLVWGIQLGQYNEYSASKIYLTWKKVKIHDLLFEAWYPISNANQPYILTIEDLEVYNVINGWRLFNFTYTNLTRCKFHDISLIASGFLILAWGNEVTVSECEFYNINGPITIYVAKEGGGGTKFINNYIHDCTLTNVLGLYGSNWNANTPCIFSDNIIYNITVSESTFYWRANQYLSGTNLASKVENNIFTNITGPGFMFHSGGNNCIIKNNILQCTGQSFRADYEAGQAGGSTYTPGDSSGSMLSNMVLTNIQVRDLDRELIGSPLGRLLPFVNVQYNSVEVWNSDDYFYDYKYLDVKVVDINNVPISGATVNITNITNLSYPSIDMKRNIKTSFTTGNDGHTPLPSDSLNTAVILNNLRNSVTNVVMSHTIQATLSGISNTITVTPDSTWYRTNPEIYQNTVTIQLLVDTLLGSITGKITDINNVAMSGVLIENSNGYSTTSDINGNYTISTLSPGNYSLTVSKIGYISQTYNYSIVSTETINKDFVLLDCPTPICEFTVIQL